MIRYYLYTFTTGEQNLYVVVATQLSYNARTMAWEAVSNKHEGASIIGLHYVKTLAGQEDFNELVNLNEHYNLNFQEIDNLLITQTEGVSIGDWVKE